MSNAGNLNVAKCVLVLLTPAATEAADAVQDPSALHKCNSSAKEVFLSTQGLCDITT